jgi:hypothetical protein
MYRNNVVTELFFCFDASLFSWLGNQSPLALKDFVKAWATKSSQKKQLHSRAEKLYIYNGNWIDQARARSYKTWFDRPVVQLCCQNFEIVSRNKTQESHLSPPQCFSHVPETCFRVGFFWCFESLFIANNSTSWTQKFDHTIMNLWINKSMRKFVNKSMNEYSSTQIQENTCFIACPRTAIAANRRTWILV